MGANVEGTTDAWNPGQYERFAAERSQPFFDLLALIEGQGHERVADLGCGTGALTLELHRHLQAATTVGIDSSPAMLEQAREVWADGLRFELGDIGELAEHDLDVVFSNAALHWLPEQRATVALWRAALRPGGQLAVQVPANADHPAYRLAGDIAHEPPFADAFGGDMPVDPASRVLAPEVYAALLDELGFERQHVRLQVYGHDLSSSAEVVEWLRGTNLTRFERRLSPELFALFLDRYRSRLPETIGERSPYFFAFKRILFWGRLP